MTTQKATIIIFGGTGDLTKKKLVPAISSLVETKTLSKTSTIIGIGRSDNDDLSYKKYILSNIKDKKVKNQISKLKIKYFKADVSKKDSLSNLSNVILDAEGEGSCHRLFYFATSYKLFSKILDQIEIYDLNKKDDCYTKIAFEKPFGEDFKSCSRLEKKLHKIFDEKQIFRVDHYLGKETVLNINMLKFANPIFNSVFNEKFVERIEITVDENLSVGSRASYYNEFGTIKDMFQSHLLQVASIVLMRRPKELTPKCIHDEKIKILKNLKIMAPRHHLLGEYASYERELKNLGLKYKRTETFAKIKFICDTKEWGRVPITIRSGKMLKSKFGKVTIYLKNTSLNVKKKIENIKQNKLLINIQPMDDIKMYLNVKDKERNDKTEFVSFDFCNAWHFGANSSDGYERIIQDILIEDKTNFSSGSEIKESWRIIDRLNKIKKKIKYVKYIDFSDPEKL